MKDQKVEEEMLWAQVSEVEGIVQKVPLALKLGDAILQLLFKPGYTIRLIGKTKQSHTLGDPADETATSPRLTVRGVDERLIWSSGLATIGNINNEVSDERFLKTRYYLLSLLLICSSSKLSSNFSMVSPGG
jgi:hypothetical protein